MMGALDRAAVCIIDSFDAWATSTIIPSRFISAITCLPRGESPLFPAVALAGCESASWLWPLWVSDR